MLLLRCDNIDDAQKACSGACARPGKRIQLQAIYDNVAA
jgi:hypothetical protein